MRKITYELKDRLVVQLLQMIDSEYKAFKKTALNKEMDLPINKLRFCGTGKTVLNSKQYERFRTILMKYGFPPVLPRETIESIGAYLNKQQQKDLTVLRKRILKSKYLKTLFSDNPAINRKEIERAISIPENSMYMAQLNGIDISGERLYLLATEMLRYGIDITSLPTDKLYTIDDIIKK